MSINIAILGVGRWGVHFVRHCLHHPDTNLVAIVDPEIDNLKNCRDKFDIDENSVILTDNWHDIRLNPAIDAVIVVTPATTHYPLVLDALNLGYHVLAEKPLTLDYRECLELTELAAKKGLTLTVDHTYLFHEAVREGKKLLRSSKIGTPLYGYSTRTHLGPVRNDVSVLWDLAIHDIAIFNTWLDSSPRQVRARGLNFLQPGIPDTVWLDLIYPDNFQSTVHLSWLNTDKQRRLTVVGTLGTLIFDELNTQHPLTACIGHFQRYRERFEPSMRGVEFIPVAPTEPLKEVFQDFIDSITTGSPSLSSGSVAMELVRVLQALDLSLSRDGETIDVG